MCPPATVRRGAVSTSLSARVGPRRIAPDSAGAESEADPPDPPAASECVDPKGDAMPGRTDPEGDLLPSLGHMKYGPVGHISSSF